MASTTFLGKAAWAFGGGFGPMAEALLKFENIKKWMHTFKWCAWQQT